MFKVVDGIQVNMTTSEIDEWNAQQGAAVEEQANYVPPDPLPTIVASAQLTVSGAWPETTVEAVMSSGISLGFAMDVGSYYVFFNTPQPDLAYAVYASASAGYINVVSRTLDYVELCIKDGGVPFDPMEFSINIVRST